MSLSREIYFIKFLNKCHEEKMKKMKKTDINKLYEELLEIAKKKCL